MYLGTSRERNKKRANRNFLIIFIGFICSLVVVIYAMQSMMTTMNSQKNKQVHLLHCEIENQADTQACKINVGDVILFEAPLPPGKTIFEHKWHFDTTKTITAIFGGLREEIQNVIVTDSISYLMITIKPSLQSKYDVEVSFFE